MWNSATIPPRFTVPVEAKSRPDLLDDVIATIFDSLLVELQTPDLQTADQVDVIRSLARGISVEVGEQIEQRLGGNRELRAQAVPNRSYHFWCVFLAAICKAYDEGFDWAEETADAAVEKIFDLVDNLPGQELTTDFPNAHGTHQRGREGKVVPDAAVPEDRLGAAFGGLQRDVWEPIIKTAVNHVIDAAKDLGNETVVKYIRVIALIVCPDPDRHPAVVKYCLWPLLKEPILTALQENLRQAFKTWLKTAYPKLRLT